MLGPSDRSDAEACRFAGTTDPSGKVTITAMSPKRTAPPKWMSLRPIPALSGRTRTPGHPTCRLSVAIELRRRFRDEHCRLDAAMPGDAAAAPQYQA